MQTVLELVSYYANLLILQYLQKTKAYATIQALVKPVLIPQVSIQELIFSGVAASGTFVLSYDLNPTATINWNDSTLVIQGKLQAVFGLGAVTVAGSIASQTLIVTLTGVTPPADLLVVSADGLLDGSSNPVLISVEEMDVTLPIAIQNAFNLLTAVGSQLDVLGKYAGVTRSGFGFTGFITLDDAEFLQLIQMSILRNTAGSSLATIQTLIGTYFPGQILVFDYADMRLSYILSSVFLPLDLVQLFISEGLLPKPMGVQLSSVIYAPDILTLFGFRTYFFPAHNASPFNSYQSYQTDFPWLTYQYAIVI